METGSNKAYLLCVTYRVILCCHTTPKWVQNVNITRHIMKRSFNLMCFFKWMLGLADLLKINLYSNQSCWNMPLTWPTPFLSWSGRMLGCNVINLFIKNNSYIHTSKSRGRCIWTELIIIRNYQRYISSSHSSYSIYSITTFLCLSGLTSLLFMAASLA